jgi:hypothetical protein
MDNFNSQCMNYKTEKCYLCNKEEKPNSDRKNLKKKGFFLNLYKIIRCI